MRARVLVTPKAGILDPQGQAVERALPALGFTGVRNVSVGRLIELDVEDPDRLPEMCQRLLTNPLIEDYEITVAGDAPQQPPKDPHSWGDTPQQPPKDPRVSGEGSRS